jgi:hypothetical protein
MRRPEIPLFDGPMAPGTPCPLENRLLPVRHHATMQIHGGFHLTPTPLPKVKSHTDNGEFNQRLLTFGKETKNEAIKEREKERVQLPLRQLDKCSPFVLQ